MTETNENIYKRLTEIDEIKTFQTHLENMLRETSAIPYFLHSALRLEEPFTAYKDRTTGIK